MILDEHSLCNIIMFTISINQISSKSFLKPVALVILINFYIIYFKYVGKINLSQYIITMSDLGKTLYLKYKTLCKYSLFIHSSSVGPLLGSAEYDVVYN